MKPKTNVNTDSNTGNKFEINEYSWDDLSGIIFNLIDDLNLEFYENQYNSKLAKLTSVSKSYYLFGKFGYNNYGLRISEQNYTFGGNNYININSFGFDLEIFKDTKRKRVILYSGSDTAPNWILLIE